MNGRIRMEVRMELLADTLFYAGFSVLGGESLAPVRDGDGFPYLKAGTLKHLLKESMADVLFWRGGEEDIGERFGSKGMDRDLPRAVRVTALNLQDPPADPEECFRSRAIIKIDRNGTDGVGLSTAKVARKGLVFSGWVDCAGEDETLVRDSFSAIKWAGKWAARGLGRVQFSLGEARSVEPESAAVPGPCLCIHYRLRSQTPVHIRSLRESSGRYKATRDRIPGSVIRGAVMERLADREPEWFAANKATLLSDRVRFLDALPNPDGRAVIPTPSGFYEKKDGSAFVNVVRAGEVAPGSKRAELGRFCALEDGVLDYWDCEHGSLLCNEWNRGSYTLLYLKEGQAFDGCILLEDGELAPAIARMFGGELLLGSERSSGFGRCAVECLEAAEEPAAAAAYGYAAEDDPGELLYMLALSPLSMLDGRGEPCGLNLEVLARELGVERVEIDRCSSGIEEFGGYNRAWGCQIPLMTMYRPGSLFRLKCSAAPEGAALKRLQHKGLGVRRAEGYGQVLFLRRGLFEALNDRRERAADESEHKRQAVRIRRAKYQWVMDTESKIRGWRSKEYHLLAEKCKDEAGLRAYLDKFQTRNWKAREGAKLCRAVLDRPLAETLGLAVPTRTEEQMTAEKLELLGMLFRYSASGAENGEEKGNGGAI